jgi:hypothetical protein
MILGKMLRQSQAELHQSQHRSLSNLSQEESVEETYAARPRRTRKVKTAGIALHPWETGFLTSGDEQQMHSR